jgi:hypothetical protein
MNFITIKLYGGLGNQLFQLFSLIGIAKKNGYEYLIDKQYNGDRKSYWNTILHSLPNCENVTEITKNIENPSILRENRFSEYMNINLDKTKHKSVFLDGYFQSFYYFEHIRDFVFETIIKNQSKDLLEKINKKHQELKDKYQNKQLIMIHCRKGDYNNKIHNDYYPILSMEYYNKAISHFDKDECAFMIFSDDIETTKKEFETIILKNKEFISLEEDYIEFLLMTRMDGAIISNSTFSLWSAYLMDYHRTKKIVCPKYFFREWDIHRLDFFEKHWNFIENTEVFRDVKVDPKRT